MGCEKVMFLFKQIDSVLEHCAFEAWASLNVHKFQDGQCDCEQAGVHDAPLDLVCLGVDAQCRKR